MDLNKLGKELDTARRARLAPPSDHCVEAFDGTSTTQQLSVSPSAYSDQSTGSDAHGRPYPLCLICLTRPPSAVLLPCQSPHQWQPVVLMTAGCHLNLCHLCAAHIIERHRRTYVPNNPVQDPSRAIDVQPPSTREPWHVLAARASANHPKSRRLSGGGYTAPPRNSYGGEFTGDRLLPAKGDRGLQHDLVQDQDRVSGLRSAWHETRGGEVKLARQGPTTEIVEEAKCLVCRSGVQGWLRVYTG